MFCHAQNKGIRRFCGYECESIFEVIERRILSLYAFEREKQAQELEKLKALGCDYRFEKPHENLNDFYFQVEPSKPQSKQEWEKATEDFYEELGYRGDKNE